MQGKLFVGKLQVRVSDYENAVTLLLVANSQQSAWRLLESAAQNYYGDGSDPEENGGYNANGGEVFVSAKSLDEIGLSTFLELKPHFMVRREANVAVPDESAYEAPMSELAQAFTAALNRKERVVSHSHVLNALASAYGHKNWHVLKGKLEGASSTPNTVPHAECAKAVEAEQAPDHELKAQHQKWVASEKLRVGLEKIRFIEGHGYNLEEIGTGSGWYALLPGETSFKQEEEGQNYLGFFSTLDSLVEELSEKLEYLPDEVAIGLSMMHRISVLRHKTPVLCSRYFWVGGNYSFETAADAARDALRTKGVRHAKLHLRINDSIEAKRREVANLMFDACEFEAPVAAVNGWEAGDNVMQCAVFLEMESALPSKKVVFRVSFKKNSAEPDGWSLT